MFPRAVPRGAHWSQTAEAHIANTLFGSDKQTGQPVFHFKPPSLYRAFMLVLFTFCFCIMGLFRAWLLIYLFPFFKPVFLLMLSILNSEGVSNQKKEVFCGLRGSLSQVILCLLSNLSSYLFS